MKKQILSVFYWVALATSSFGQEFIFPDTDYWNILKEGTSLSFKLRTTDAVQPIFSLGSGSPSEAQIDSLGNFNWIPSFETTSRIEKQKEIVVFFQAHWKDGRKLYKSLNFTVFHQNRAPVLEELPTFYVKQSSLNQYQISSDYITDPDEDPIVFKSILSQMPEGATLTSQGLFTWTPSRYQFYTLKKNPLIVEFIVQDQPEKLESIGKIKIAPTQLDLPPEILLLPNDSVVTIKEDERINFRIYISDPNGDENISNLGFFCLDKRLPKTSFVANTPVQGEFIWSPGYDFVEPPEKEKTIEVLFFALDKSGNRTQRKVKVKIVDTENLEERDKVFYEKYVNTLTAAKGLLDILDKNHEKLNKLYKQAKKGKKNRAILNATLGATTGLAPVALSNDPASYKTVSAVGGTTVLTLGTLEATEVIGKSKADIMEKLKVNIEIRNRLQSEGDSFARKYSIKSTRRDNSFEPDREKFLPLLNSPQLLSLELDASKSAKKKYTQAELKKTFVDFSEE